MTEYTNTPIPIYKNVILIPYRNREEHLQKFLTYSIPLFEKYLQPYKVIIIEQEEGKLFNRGTLLNIGFNEYKDKAEFFFTHDVDMIPIEKCVNELYTKNNYEVIRISVPHDISFGQICKFTKTSIFSSNGFPNYIWGWGLEDRALFYRYTIMNHSISPNYTNDTNFIKLYHKSNCEIYVNEKKRISDKESEIFNCNDKAKQITYIMSSGLNNLEYKIIAKEHVSENIEIIKVSI